MELAAVMAVVAVGAVVALAAEAPPATVTPAGVGPVTMSSLEHPAATTTATVTASASPGTGRRRGVDTI